VPYELRVSRRRNSSPRSVPKIPQQPTASISRDRPVYRIDKRSYYLSAEGRNAVSAPNREPHSFHSETNVTVGRLTIKIYPDDEPLSSIQKWQSDG
jgi:hypothetical protein